MAEKKDPSVKRHGITAFSVVMFTLLIVFLALVITSMYKIDETEYAVITRLGRYSKTVGAGLHIKLPFGIDKCYKVAAPTVVHTEQFGFRTVKPGTTNQYKNNITKESTMLTGDLNIVDVEWIIQYQIVDPVAWLFSVNDKMQTIRDISQSVINSLVGDRAILDIMGDARSSIQIEAKDMMNANYKRLNLGIEVNTVQLQNVVAPEGVQEAFDDVSKAKQDMERFINEGKEAYNAQIPLTRGEAEQKLQVAQGYAIDRVNRAKGDVARFMAVYDEYRKSPTVTRERLYLETMESIFNNSTNSTIIDKELSNVLPIKNLANSSAKETN